MFWLAATVGTLVALGLALATVVAVWRMSRTHERLERHVAEIERNLAARLRRE